MVETLPLPVEAPVDKQTNLTAETLPLPVEAPVGRQTDLAAETLPLPVEAPVDKSTDPTVGALPLPVEAPVDTYADKFRAAVMALQPFINMEARNELPDFKDGQKIALQIIHHMGVVLRSETVPTEQNASFPSVYMLDYFSNQLAERASIPICVATQLLVRVQRYANQDMWNPKWDLEAFQRSVSIYPNQAEIGRFLCPARKKRWKRYVLLLETCAISYSDLPKYHSDLLAFAQLPVVVFCLQNVAKPITPLPVADPNTLEELERYRKMLADFERECAETIMKPFVDVDLLTS